MDIITVDSDPRFAAKTRRLPFSDCVYWTGALYLGYGIYWLSEGRTVLAHRYALEQHLGRPLREGMGALHTCDVARCVNPAHLYEGDQRANMRDALQRGRLATKLDWGKVSWIRDAYSRGWTQVQLARRFGVSASAISAVVRHRAWVESSEAA